MVMSDRPHMTIWHLRIASWITKGTDTYSKYVIRIAFPRQQWLRERASTLSYTYAACLACFYAKRDGSPSGPKHVANR